MNPTFTGNDVKAFIPGVILASAAFFAGIFFFLNSGGRKISVKIFLLYSLATVFLFALMALTGLIEVENPLTFYLGSSAGMLLLGSLHVWVLSSLSKPEDESLFLNELFFTIYVSFLAGGTYLFLFDYFHRQGYEYVLVSTLVSFIVPFFFYKTFHYLISIPNEEYEKWYFPIDKNFDDDSEDDFEDEKKTIIVKLEIVGHTAGDDKTQSTQALAPLRWDFGDYFGFIIVNYNDKNPGKKIQYMDEYGQPQGWNFYIKPKWYQSPRYIDHKLSISENELTGKETIVCERV